MRHALSIRKLTKTKYFIKKIIYLKNEPFCDTSHHQVIYAILELNKIFSLAIICFGYFNKTACNDSFSI